MAHVFVTHRYQGALGELHALLAARKVTPVGPGGAIYANGLFSHARGQATVFVLCRDPVRATGRVTELVVPEADIAVTTHLGAHNDVDLAYGALAAYVTDHALAVEGPIREYYLIGPHETTDENQRRTEIGWPIFHTGPSRQSSREQSRQLGRRRSRRAVPANRRSAR